MSTLDDLRQLSAAEEFFAYLDVPFDPAVVRVARLHILRRMGEYLNRAGWEGLDEGGIRAHCRSQLERAYADFVGSTPIAERVFKVHKEAVAPKPEPAKPFVPLAALAPSEPGQ